MASKREDLRNMLVKRLVERYGERCPAAPEAVECEVDELLNRHSRKITQDELRHLERKVDRQTKRLAEREEERKLSANRKANQQAAMAAAELEAGVGGDDELPIPLDSYIVFNTAQEIQHKRDEVSRLKNKRDNQRKMKDELDAQVHLARQRGGDDVAAESQYAAHVKKQHEEFVDEQKKAQRSVKTRNRIVKSERDEQMRQIQARRDRAYERNRKEEAIMIENAKEELAKEAQRRRQIIIDQKSYMLKVQQENVKQKMLRGEQRQLDQDEDKRLQREYAARLDEQERLRLDTYEKMKEKSSNNQKMYMLATEEKNRQDKEDEDRALAYQHEKIHQEELKAQEQINERLQNKKDMNAVLAQQVALHDQRKREESEAQKIFAVSFKADAVRAIEAEKQAARNRRAKAFEHKHKLEAQIIERKTMPRDTDSSAMTEFEKQINRVNMMQLCKDPEIVEVVAERLARQRIARENRSKAKEQTDDLIV